MPTRENGAAHDPTRTTTPAGERVTIDEVGGSRGRPPILEDLQDVLNSPGEPGFPGDRGQVLYSEDGVNWAARTPITTRNGWLVNDLGRLIVKDLII